MELTKGNIAIYDTFLLRHDLCELPYPLMSLIPLRHLKQEFEPVTPSCKLYNNPSPFSATTAFYITHLDRLHQNRIPCTHPSNILLRTTSILRITYDVTNQTNHPFYTLVPTHQSQSRQTG